MMKANVATRRTGVAGARPRAPARPGAGHAQARDRPARQLGHVGLRSRASASGIFKKHGLVLEILYTQGGGETQQAVISGSVDIGVAAGIMGALSRLLQGRAGAHHRRGDDRRRGPVLVRAGGVADQDAEGHRRQDDRLFDQRLVDARHRQRVRQAVRPEGEAHRDRRPRADADAGDVEPDRRRLVGAAVRPRPARPGQDPHRSRSATTRRCSRARRCVSRSPTRRRCRRASR